MAHTAREEVLSRIKAALKSEAPRKVMSFAVPTVDEIRRRCDERREHLVEQFASELTRVGGHLFRASSPAAASEYVERLLLSAGASSVVAWDSPLIDSVAPVSLFERLGVEFLRDGAAGAESDFVKAAIDSEVGITAVDYAIADTGTLVLISGPGRARSASLVPPVHLALVEARQIISGLDDLFALLSDSSPASAITFITGPSRTADIELTLVVGVHGPQQLHVILLAE
ncbi:MAG TPA: lactate utilization protein [Blastocatellia bacterium]|nr:lactate utilization protein [Blastocatellia bacterium]